ncbi:hypothetical protein BGZ61DRAFT_455244 [Ilyonectria robusta]|uniref:uncharacterized protein n=1 Tax=Ilyonectria robusta TaxID=1079257 RepID=UPI001E8DCCAE|nr:uncharacterized protein BGZ61DRAFT_455244 [Ilyonectria robusta]KAH8685296.1 hypothetical protein BGZ61DRAFT_455244 [Ilyonectria robusta]
MGVAARVAAVVVVVVVVAMVGGGKGRRPELGLLLLGGAQAEGGVPVRIRGRSPRPRRSRSRSRMRSDRRSRRRRRTTRSDSFGARRLYAAHRIAPVAMVVVVVVAVATTARVSVVIAAIVSSVRPLQHRGAVAVVVHAEYLALEADWAARNSRQEQGGEEGDVSATEVLGLRTHVHECDDAARVFGGGGKKTMRAASGVAMRTRVESSVGRFTAKVAGGRVRGCSERRRQRIDGDLSTRATRTDLWRCGVALRRFDQRARAVSMGRESEWVKRVNGNVELRGS